MKGTFSFDNFDAAKAVELARIHAGSHYSNEMGVVVSIAFRDIRNLPALRFKEDVEIKLDDYISRWVIAYFNGYNNRPSVRIGNKSNTYSDPIIKIILQARLPIEDELANQIENGHSLMMTIENLVGDLLEEYLSCKLRENGWCCCWGSTVDAVDFVKKDGSLIQIKNSDNSENSSSGRVRAGTTIKKWCRRKSTKENTFHWHTLNGIVERDDLSEDAFRTFVIQTIKANPNSIYVL